MSISLTQSFEKLTCQCADLTLPDKKGRTLYQWILENWSELTYKQRVCILRDQYHKTAITGKPSLPTRKFIRLYSQLEPLKTKLENGKRLTCLNLGAGTGRDIPLLDAHFKSTHYDIHEEFGEKFNYSLVHDFKLLDNAYDIVVCNYILNVIVRYDRSLVENILRHYLGNGSVILIGVRHQRDLPRSAEKWFNVHDSMGNFDGYLTSKPSFQHFYTDEEIFNAFEHYTSEIRIIDKRGIYLLIPKIIKSNTLDKF